MSMALVCEGLQSWFREKYQWKPNQCGVQKDGIPAADAGPFFVSIVDRNVEAGNEETDSLKETCNVSIGIWRKPEHLMSDRKGMNVHPNDKYLTGIWTLYALERAVLVPRHQGNRWGVHKSYDFLNYLNTLYSLPSEDYGDAFKTPLAYRGRTQQQTIAYYENNNEQVWLGYYLQFRGCYREQALRYSDRALA